MRVGVNGKKTIRTLQSQLWFLKQQKDFFYLWSRRLLQIPHETDFYALRLISQYFNGTYVDIGGNHGQSIESIRLLVPDADIVSFEPNPVLSRKLSQRYLGNPRIEIRGVGLSDCVGTLKLHQPSYRGYVYDGLSSLDQEAARGWINTETVYFFRPASLKIETYDCPIETLDMQGLDPVFIKIDVQGLEYKVLAGGLETIKRHLPILLVEDYHSDPRIGTLMKEQGYEEYGFDGSHFIRGHAKGPNSFLLTRKHLEYLPKAHQLDHSRSLSHQQATRKGHPEKFGVGFGKAHTFFARARWGKG